MTVPYKMQTCDKESYIINTDLDVQNNCLKCSQLDRHWGENIKDNYGIKIYTNDCKVAFRAPDRKRSLLRFSLLLSVQPFLSYIGLQESLGDHQYNGHPHFKTYECVCNSTLSGLELLFQTLGKLGGFPSRCCNALQVTNHQLDIIN